MIYRLRQKPELLGCPFLTFRQITVGLLVGTVVSRKIRNFLHSHPHNTLQNAAPIRHVLLTDVGEQHDDAWPVEQVVASSFKVVVRSSR